MIKSGQIRGTRRARRVLALFVAVIVLTVVQMTVSEEADPKAIREFIRTIPSSLEKTLLKEGACINKKNDTGLGAMCGFEVNRGAIWKYEEITIEKWNEVCIRFKGFQQDLENGTYPCSKYFCFDMKTSTTFWCIIIGGPLSIIVAIVVGCYLCCHYAYYMCCCCLFHKPIPAFMNKLGTQQAPPSSQVAPVTVITPTSSGAAAPSPKTDGSKTDTSNTATASESAKDKGESKPEPQKSEKEGGEEAEKKE